MKGIPEVVKKVERAMKKIVSGGFLVCFGRTTNNAYNMLYSNY